MSRWRPERRCEASPLLPAGDPTAPAPARAMGRARAQAQSMPRCRRRPPPLAASGLVVNAVVLDRGALGLAVPYRNRPDGPRLEPDLADGVADQVGHAASRPRCCLSQGLELLFAQ